MNDQELITAVKQSVSGVHMRVPAEQIVRRSRTVRSRRAIPAVIGALAVAAGAAGAALAATGTPVPSGQASHQPTALLAAWTVTKQDNGAVKVTIRELRDPAGLQRTLRADGVPASVTFAGQQNPACQGYGGGSQSQRRQSLGRVATGAAGKSYVLTIHPSAIPSGAGVEIWSGFGNNVPASAQGLSVELVRASPQCTG